MTELVFGCCNCNNSFAVPTDTMVSNTGLKIGDGIVPQGWEVIRNASEVRFMCPRCLSDGELDRKLSQMRAIRQYILDFSSLLSDFKLNRIIENAEDIIDACRFVSERRERKRFG